MIPLLITTISGLSTMLGIIPTFISDKYKNKIVYEYNLKSFCAEGYSKRIYLMKMQCH